VSVDPLIGEELEHYRLDKVLGRGGMGVVYAGTDMALKRPVAVKVLPPHLLDDQTARARFQREIESAVAIEHPHVVPIYAAGYDKRHFFLVMRMVQGPDLAQGTTALRSRQREPRAATTWPDRKRAACSPCFPARAPGRQAAERLGGRLRRSG